MKIKFSPFYVFTIIPMPVLYVISNILFVLAYHILHYRRDVVYTNLKNSFINKDEKEIRAIEKEFYKYFCDIMLESFKTLTISKKEIGKRFHIKNIELIQKYYDENRSVILYAAHQGNWEWLAFLPLFMPHQGVTFYQPLSNKYFDELMRSIRERFGTICIDSKLGYRKLVDFKQKNILIMNAIIGDQSPSKESGKYWTRFLNQDTAFLVGAARIGTQNNQAFVFPSFTRKKRGRYELEFKPMDMKVENKNGFEIIDEYARLLEETIHKSPEMWLWSHRRWKLSRDKIV